MSFTLAHSGRKSLNHRQMPVLKVWLFISKPSSSRLHQSPLAVSWSLIPACKLSTLPMVKVLIHEPWSSSGSLLIMWTIPSLVFDTATFLLLVAGVWRRSRHHECSLLTLIARDGILYFGAVVASNTLWTVTGLVLPVRMVDFEHSRPLMCHSSLTLRMSGPCKCKTFDNVVKSV